MRLLIWLFLVLAVTGLILSLIAHLSARFGVEQPLGDAAWGLHVGIFVVWLPAIIVFNRMAKNSKCTVPWKVALRGCPVWMRGLAFGFLAYAILNFGLFILSAPPRGAKHGKDTPPVVFRGFSGHWMAFYAIAAASLYSALVVSKAGLVRRCRNGHPVRAFTQSCETCGAPLEERELGG